jgi:hypothetical protein
MKSLLALAAILVMAGGYSASPASAGEPVGAGGVLQNQNSLPGPVILEPVTPNAYGPGINSDATGRPFTWKPDFGGPALGPVTPNAYGPGIGMDSTGRPVRPACPAGWVGPC